MTEPTPQEGKDSTETRESRSAVTISEEEFARLTAKTWRGFLAASRIETESALREMQDAYHAALDANREIAKQKDSAYSQRDRLVAALSKQFPSYLSRHIGEWEEDWRNIVYVNLPTGQASWHIHDSELPWFSHLQAFGPEWDGHSDEEKHRRIEALPTGVSLRAELAEAQAEVERLMTYAVAGWTYLIGDRSQSEYDDFNDAHRELFGDSWAQPSRSLLADAATPTHEHTYDSDTKLALVAGGFVRFCDTCGNAATPEKTHSSGCPDCRWDGRHWHLCENHYRATRLAAMDEPTPETEQAP